ncbi:uncharacterized protein LOC112905244 [Agrilus planipennis]|uniref:Uncharacterized protein LOC112905244 n=1 Tax=Agrilus planipennis TaxID=224129 RepID=A0A7F5RAP6_AGRPL|nr:uncharacterized protein LOC112905244 [Agrilus planipennis]
MSGSSEKSNELESWNSSKTEAGRKNLVADNSGQNFTVPKKNEPKKLSSSVRIESENLSNYRDRKAKGEGGSTHDYAKNLETIRNKLKLLDISQRSSSISTNNDVQAQRSSSSFTSVSPRTAGLHISAPTSTKTYFPNVISNKEKKIDAETTFSNSLSSSNSSPKNDKLVKHKQVSDGSTSRSAKIINIYSPRKKMYFTSSSISNSSSNGSCFAHFDKGCRRTVVNEKAKHLPQHPKKKATSSGSTSGSSRKSQFNEISKAKRRTRKHLKKRDMSIVEVLNKVCKPKYEQPSNQSKKDTCDNVSFSTSTTDEDEEIEKELSDVPLAVEHQNVTSPLKTKRESPEPFSSRIQNFGLPDSGESSIKKYSCSIDHKQPEVRPITRRNKQTSPSKGTSKSLPMKSTKSEIRSQLQKMSQSAVSKNQNPKIKSCTTVKLATPTNLKKHTKVKEKSDCVTKLTTIKSSSSFNNTLPELCKVRIDSDVAVKSASFRKIKKSVDRIQSKCIKPKILEKTENLTLTAMICSPKEEVSSASTKSGTSPSQLTLTSPTVTERKSKKTVPSYKFPFPSATIPRAFTLEGLLCDTVNSPSKQSKVKKKSATPPCNPVSNVDDLRVYSTHLDLPNAFHSDKIKSSSYLIPYLKKKNRIHNTRRATTGDSSINRRGFSHTKSIQFTVSPKKWLLTRQSKSLPGKSNSKSSGSSQKNVETMFLNLSYSNPSTSHSETYFSETLSCPIPSKRICMREDQDYDVFQIIIENDDNSSIASTCTSPPKKMCVREKTPEISENVSTDSKKNFSDISGTPSEKDSVESVPSDDFKNSILSMLLEWRAKEIEKINGKEQMKDKSTISWVNQSSNNELCLAKNVTSESESKDEAIINDKYKMEAFAESESKEDIDLSVDFDEERFEQQLAVISEETRIVSEEDVNLRTINSTERLSIDEDLMLKLPLEPEVNVIGSLPTSASRRSNGGQNNSLREKQDATTSVEDLRLPMENKETYTSHESFRKDVGQQYELTEDGLYNKDVTASKASGKILDEKTETYNKSSWVCGCFLMPLLERSVFEAYQVPYGEGDPIISLLELNDAITMERTQQKITPNVSILEINELDDQISNDNVTSTSVREVYLNGDDDAMVPLNPNLMLSLDVPKKFLRLYDFPAFTRITTIAGSCESCVSLWEKNDIVLTEPTGSKLSSPKGRSTSNTRKSKDVSWGDNLMPEKKLPNLKDDFDQTLLTVLYRSRCSAVHSPDKSTSSICRCHSERGFSETSESQDEDGKQSGCFSCFRRLFGRRKKRFFDSHS